MKALCGRAARALAGLTRFVGVGGGGAGSLGLNEAALLRRLAANSRTKAGKNKNYLKYYFLDFPRRTKD